MLVKLSKLSLPTLGVLILLASCADETSVPPGNPGTDSGTDSATNPDSSTPQDAGADVRDSATPDADADAGDGAPPSPLVLHYTFEESNGTAVNDASGNAHHGTASVATVWTAEGRVGRGVKLVSANPATQFVSLPSGVLTGVSDFSITTWVKLASLQNWARIYDFGNGKADAANRFMYLAVPGFIEVPPGSGTFFPGLHASSFGGSPANENVLNSRTQLPVGVWKHVAVVGKGGDRTIYVDGFPAAAVKGGPVVLPSVMEPLAAQSWLGKSRFDGADPGLDGTLDEFRIYKTVLSDKEIADLAWPKKDYSSWRFDEATGTTSVDSSDNTNAATLTGGVTWTTGRLGGAIDLNGGATKPHVSFAQSPLKGCTTELTIATWVKIHALTDWAHLFDFGTGFDGGAAVSNFIMLVPRDGDGKTRVTLGAPGHAVVDMVAPTAALPADNAWHHAALTIDADGLMSLYVDGASIKAETHDYHGSDFAAATDNFLGRSRFSVNDPYLNGSLDELRVSCRAYTADEIKNLAFKQ